MKLETAFNIGDRVRIKELNREGVLLGLVVDNDGLAYRVRYFDNAKPESIYFFPEELEKGA